MAFTTRIAAVVLAAAGVGFAAPAALAQEAQGTQTQPPVESQAVSQEKLESFVLAALEVQQVQVQYAPTLEAATTEEERQQVADQAVGEMVAAVEAAPGITVDEYNMIAEAVAADPALAARAHDTMQEVAPQ